MKFFKTLFESIAQARTARILMDMSDRQLADIGISRSDIPKRVAGLV